MSSSAGGSSGDGNQVFKDPEYPVVVVDQKYCSNDPTTLTFEKNGEDKFKISDEEGHVIFRGQIKADGRKVMLDDSNAPVISFQITMHARRQAFRGDSTDQRLFSVKKTRYFTSVRYDVYMTSNLSESTFNYRVCDGNKEGSLLILAGDETTKLAQLNNQANQKCTVDVSPKVDKAFVSALLIIREDIS
ncbi:LOW QUALITY PROTEIN: hypothetical protein OSB04_020158 [Centaurea solstitialis]|uniref:Uncharacterized protein n=1 Tax=Centaurea solstitialis TaxID=347529 RepID=A0AA38T3V4_9ASTR|nr:LOW QUALITY PROTEIN: hypothetical protein OSB04_020158 [Centaurea solstitialis]